MYNKFILSERLTFDNWASEIYFHQSVVSLLLAQSNIYKTNSVFFSNPNKMTGAPNVTTSNLPTPSVQVSEGATATYTCTAEGFPQPVITWKSDGTVISTNVTQLSASNVTGLWVVQSQIELYFNRDHAGTLGCFANNGIGVEANDTAEVFVTCKYNWSQQYLFERLNKKLLYCVLWITWKLIFNKNFSPFKWRNSFLLLD